MQIEAEQPSGTSLQRSRIVIVFFDLSMPAWITDQLANSGYQVDVFTDVPSITQLKTLDVSAILLCMYANNAAGYAFCAALHRQLGAVVGVLLSGSAREETVRLLNQGVDAVWVYPMARDELFARIQALLRRSRLFPTQGYVPRRSQVLVQDRQIQIDERMIQLSGREYQLLLYLIEHANQTISRQRLLQAIWNDVPHAQSSVVEVTVRRLRAKIETDPANPQHIITVYGEGYQFVSS